MSDFNLMDPSQVLFALITLQNCIHLPPKRVSWFIELPHARSQFLATLAKKTLGQPLSFKCSG